MSYRFTQLSPQSSTRSGNMEIRVHAPADELTDQLRSASAKFRDMQFLRSWFELDTEVDQFGSRPKTDKVNWNAVMGVAVIAAISGGFWVGVGLLIARLG